MKAIGQRRRRMLLADSTRIYLIVSTLRAKDDWLETTVRVLHDHSIRLVQLRAKGVTDDQLLTWAEQLRRHCSLLILNDRPELVDAARADGAHIGDDDMDPREARDLIGPDALLGVSTHDESEVRAARDLPVDYVGLGPCFETGSKILDRPAGGPDLVRRCLPLAGTLPAFPIGGITPKNVGSLRAAGARRVAVGAGILEAAHPRRAAWTIFDALGRRNP